MDLTKTNSIDSFDSFNITRQNTSTIEKNNQNNTHTHNGVSVSITDSQEKGKITFKLDQPDTQKTNIQTNIDDRNLLQVPAENHRKNNSTNYTIYSQLFQQPIQLFFDADLLAEIVSSEKAESNFTEANQTVIKSLLKQIVEQYKTFYVDEESFPVEVECFYTPRAKGMFATLRHKDGIHVDKGGIKSTSFVAKNEDIKSSIKREGYAKIIESFLFDITRDAIQTKNDGFYLASVTENTETLPFGSDKGPRGKLDNKVYISLNEIVNLNSKTIDRESIRQRVIQQLQQNSKSNNS